MDSQEIDPAADQTGETVDVADAEVVDEEILLELFTMLDDGSPDGLISACNMFLVGVPDSLAELEGALASGRLDEAGRTAHRLRGTAGAFGARRLSALAERLERLCGQGDATSTGRIVETMRDEFVLFRAILASRLASLPKG